MNLSTVDLFCGCGGLSQGLSNAGLKVVAGVDGWKSAISVYRANNPGHDSHLHDLGDEDATVELLSGYFPFLIAGGPPCQDFSSAGGRVEGDRAALTVTFANVVTRLGPNAFIMENVPRARNSAAFKQALSIFREHGYGLTVIILNASLCGVPQLRKRLFLIGMKGEKDDFLLPSLAARVSDVPMSIREYAPDLVDFDFYYRHPRTYDRKAIYSIDEPSPTIRGINRPKPPTYRMHVADSHHPADERVQSLNLEQRARIQTFPAGYFDVAVPKSDKEQMIGNAVPVALAEFVGTALLSYVRNRMDNRGRSAEIAAAALGRLRHLKALHSDVPGVGAIEEMPIDAMERRIYAILEKISPTAADGDVDDTAWEQAEFPFAIAAE